ncbi:hypothetical protein MALG_00999 [Marinovum algicola DG 898]|nr:hypothetical protein MALG_00999 [Marinovum algicola DG 898]
MRVYKFRTAKRALEIIRDKRIKISKISELNDPFEFMAPALRKRSDRNAWKEMRNRLASNRGVICFSSSWENPVLWSHYGDSHKGVALGFDVRDEFLADVVYEPERLTVNDITQLSDNQKFNLVEKAFRTKFMHWKYESELRLFTSLTEERDGQFFMELGEDLQLKEVILGANSAVERNEIENAWGGSQDLEIVTARLAVKSFKVVKQLNPAFQR